jgi:gamma-glutamyltranspeptidase / glutathione hydrolase
MDDFSSPGLTNAFGFAPSPVNFIRPFKRPQSSIASSIAEDLDTGELVIVTGSAGGSRIITATLQNLHNVLDNGATANQSVHTARWHDQLGLETLYEIPADGSLWNGTLTRDYGLPGIDNGTLEYLRGLGYNLTSQTTTGSVGHVIVRNADGTYEAANDPRKSAGGGSAY